MNFSFYDFEKLHHESFKAEIKNRISNIIDSGRFIEGEYNLKFEKEFAELQHSKYCRLVANGTDALEISLLALGFGPGDVVGVPGITFFATAEAVLNIGATPLLIDVDEKTAVMCPLSLERLCKKYNIAAIIPVHIYGVPAPMNKIEKICKQYNIKIVEDAAQAQGSFIGDSPIGSGNNLTTFSFYPTKNLSAFGDAGCILTQDEPLMKKIESIRNHGRGNENILGRNSRCDHIQAAVLHLKLSEIEKNNSKRKVIASWYHRNLDKNNLRLLPDEMLAQSSWHLYPVFLNSKEDLEKVKEHLTKMNIGSAPFYEKSLNQELPLQKFDGEWEVAEQLAGTTICLPIHPNLTEEQVKTVASELNTVFSS